MNRNGRAALAAIALALAASLSGCGSAQAQPQLGDQEFTLGEHDKVIAEAPGCSAECKIMGPSLRRCVLRDLSCRAVCQTLPECRPDGLRPIKVCAVVRGGL